MNNSAILTSKAELQNIQNVVLSSLREYGEINILDYRVDITSDYPEDYPKYYPNIYDNILEINIVIQGNKKYIDEIFDTWKYDVKGWKTEKKYESINYQALGTQRKVQEKVRGKGRVIIRRQGLGQSEDLTSLKITLTKYIWSVKSINLNKIFDQANESYKLKDINFYVSSKPILDGNQLDNKPIYFHYALLPSYEMNKYGYYQPGNIDDVEKIYNSASKDGIFKSFYCTLCASGETNNIAGIEYDKIGADMGLYKDNNNAYQPKGKANYAQIIRYPVYLNNILFYITGTSPPYLYGHLLLFPDMHMSTYLMLMSQAHVSGIYSLLNENIGSVAIFNGNYGSDIYHGHVHLTNQKLFVVEDSCKKINNIVRTKKSQYTGGIKMEGYAFQGVTLYSENVNKLYTEIASYSLLYFSDNFMSRNNLSMSAILYVCPTNKGNIFVATIFISDLNKKMGLKLNDSCAVNSIIPAFEINYANCKDSRNDPVITRKILDYYKEGFITSNSLINERSNIKFKDNNIKNAITERMGELLNTENIDKIPSEAIQWFIYQFDKSFKPAYDLDSDILKDFANKLIQDQKACISRGHDCPQNIFASFKILFTVYVLKLLFSSINNSPNKSLSDSIYNLYSDDFILEAGILGNLGNMYDNFSVKQTKSLTISSRTTNETVLNTLSNLINITSKNKYVDNEKVNMWLEYIYKRIGDPSAFGYLTFSNIKYNDSSQLPIAIKILAKEENALVNDLFQYEMVLGTKMSQLRADIPNYVMNFGGFRCNSTRNSNDEYAEICDGGINSALSSYIIMEKLPGTTLGTYINTLEYEDDWRLLLAMGQICVALQYGQDKVKFTHYDFHIGNVMMVNNGSSNASDNFKYYKYKWSTDNKNKNKNINREYKLRAQYTTVILDYGTSHADFSNYPDSKNVEIPKSIYNSTYYTIYGMTIDKFKQSADVHSMLVSILFTMITSNFELFRRSKMIQILYQQISPYLDIIYDIPFMQVIQESIDLMSQNQYPDVKQLRNFLGFKRKDKGYYLYLPANVDLNLTPDILYNIIKNILVDGGYKYLFDEPTSSPTVCTWNPDTYEHGCSANVGTQ